MHDQRHTAISIAAELTSLIHAGRWHIGDKLPTEAELSARYEVSRPTVRSALTMLAGNGLAESHQGRGWYVLGDRREAFPLDTINAKRLTANDDVWHSWVRSLGRTAAHELIVSVEQPPRDVGHILQLRGDEYCVARRRIRYVDGDPWMISTGYWPMWLANGTPLAKQGKGDSVDMRDPSPLKWAALNGWPALRERNEIGARMPTSAEAHILGMPTAQPVLTMHTTSTSTDSRPIRCTADTFPAYRFLLTVGRAQKEE